MTNYYEEMVDGERLLRFQPGARHEAICHKLHAVVATCLAGNAATRLLTRRTAVELRHGTIVRPDLALVTAATGKVWLVAEIVASDDHRADTVVKKTLYEEVKLPRLWMVDPRYNNVEIYHGTPYGLALKTILAGREPLTEALLPGLSLVMNDLFAVET